eukprot:TRINITY_DN7684_c0_g1_i9.p1 TRINITY_DN7684_c0_g1~~TRINITY_DN7684_c0_g1_i9.p1  ORF type:complete len:157 (-),score=8.91 TRINITY_DN7684_c0_g1_i9:682-1152(-)
MHASNQSIIKPHSFSTVLATVLQYLSARFHSFSALNSVPIHFHSSCAFHKFHLVSFTVEHSSVHFQQLKSLITNPLACKHASDLVPLEIYNEPRFITIFLPFAVCNQLGFIFVTFAFKSPIFRPQQIVTPQSNLALVTRFQFPTLPHFIYRIHLIA